MGRGHAHMLDDSALRECDESRGTRYSERHSGPLRRRQPSPTKRSLMPIMQVIVGRAELRTFAHGFMRLKSD